jgi:hypothetical protein
LGQIQELHFARRDDEDAILEEVVRGAPYFSNYESAYRIFLFREREGLPGDDPTPDCYVKIEPYGLLFNVLGSSKVCDAVEAHLAKEINRRWGALTKEL